MTSWASATLAIPRMFLMTARRMRMVESEIKAMPDKKVDILRGHKGQWAQNVLSLLGVERRVIGSIPEFPRPCIFVGNHIGFFDIPLVMTYAPVCFVAKIELRKWLVIGRGCELTETILVNRSSGASRRNVGEQIGIAIRQDQKQLCIFPSGTTTLHEDAPWQTGAFRIAQANGIPIVPFRLRYDPLRPAAYIEKDNLIRQLWKSQVNRPIRAEIEFHAPVMVQDPKTDCAHWQNWARAVMTPSSEIALHPSAFATM